MVPLDDLRDDAVTARRRRLRSPARRTCAPHPPPFFSVVVPTYNRAHLIAPTLRSVLAQTFAAFELLVIDDGSTDDTAAVVAGLATPRLRYIRKANGERGAARNFGLARARGDYVVFLDSDDLFEADHLAILRRAIAAQPRPPNFLATRNTLLVDGRRRPGLNAAMKAGWYGLDAFARGNFLSCNLCVRRANPRLRPFIEDRGLATAEDWLFLLQNTEADRVLLVDADTVTMVEHAERSLRADGPLVAARLRAALDWMGANLHLTPRQLRHARGRVDWVCATYAYSEDRRARAWRLVLRSLGGVSAGESLGLMARLLLGVRQVQRLRGAFARR